jgi:hypothetical protein
MSEANSGPFPNGAPTAAALSASRNLQFEFIIEASDLAASYARSASEAAYRGDELTLGVHLRQLRLVVIESLKTFKELGDGGEKAEAA